MKTLKKTFIFKKRFSIALLLTPLMFCVMFIRLGGIKKINASNDIINENYSGQIKNETITFKHEKDWYVKEQDVVLEIKIEEEKILINNEKIEKINAKIGLNGKWIDVSEDKNILINENSTIYLEIIVSEDKEKKTFNVSKYIECFDRERPVVLASYVDERTIDINTIDNISGIKDIYINNEKYTGKDNNFKISLEKDSEHGKAETIRITTIDNANNVSQPYILDNIQYIKNSDIEKENLKQTTVKIEAPQQPTVQAQVQQQPTVTQQPTVQAQVQQQPTVTQQAPTSQTQTTNSGTAENNTTSPNISKINTTSKDLYDTSVIDKKTSSGDLPDGGR